MFVCYNYFESAYQNPGFLSCFTEHTHSRSHSRTHIHTPTHCVFVGQLSILELKELSARGAISEVSGALHNDTTTPGHEDRPQENCSLLPELPFPHSMSFTRAYTRHKHTQMAAFSCDMQMPDSQCVYVCGGLDAKQTTAGAMIRRWQRLRGLKLKDSGQTVKRERQRDRERRVQLTIFITILSRNSILFPAFSRV